MHPMLRAPDRAKSVDDERARRAVEGLAAGRQASMSCHTAALAGHLATLIEFHHDDDRDTQHADPILEAFHPPELSSLRLKTESGRQFMVSVIELPA